MLAYLGRLFKILINFYTLIFKLKISAYLYNSSKNSFIILREKKLIKYNIYVQIILNLYIHWHKIKLFIYFLILINSNFNL